MKVGRNDPCPCGSGKKFKSCHLGLEVAFPLGQFKGAVAEISLDPKKLNLHPALTLTDMKVTAKITSVRESPMPLWYLELALDTARRARAEDLSPSGTLHTVLLTTLAAEAIINRLLEPRVRKEWAKVEGRPMASKWARLSRELRLKPEMNENAAPLKALSDLARLRNELVHLKFGRNITVGEQELPAVHGYSPTKGFTSKIRYPDQSVVRLPVVKDSSLPEQLDPRKAWGYFMALVDVLRLVLAKYPDDSFGTREGLLAVIKRVDAITESS